MVTINDGPPGRRLTGIYQILTLWILFELALIEKGWSSNLKNEGDEVSVAQGLIPENKGGLGINSPIIGT